ncbi:hypothetical protein INR77_02370 [Erythrobacter sp. SCSIO 43205]|uniref:hypothetical protein n=1 Tax=Erythrobacter sp. SCSIO 43205 TaxID=2779361 RepID=UPI001CA952D4|nr:hypothetical protein [Erythrobacter sp. SCSIO 43205]UAB78602.1 hypothetical protein INR77_02370 [Erythrobacter sp. SCSIO 43205]
MIDYFALALGHGLLVLVFVRLVVRDSLDVDPAITALREQARTKRPNSAQRRASRKAAAREPDDADQ